MELKMLSFKKLIAFYKFLNQKFDVYSKNIDRLLNFNEIKNFI